MPPVAGPVPEHIPAWKKLGLKLKFAKEKPDDDSNESRKEEKSDERKRKRTDNKHEISAETTSTDKPAKRAKKSKSRENGNEIIAASDSKSINGTQGEDSPSVERSNTPSSKRKSVSFTPETKTQDGEGIKQVYKTWVDRQRANDPSFDPSNINPALRLQLKSVEPPTTNSHDPIKKSKKEKHRRKREVTRTSNVTPSSVTDSALTYLTAHHKSPESWKFSKPHQNHLLKHLFSFTHIPSTYDPALLNYFRDLQGSARSRIRQQALTVRENDLKWLESEPTGSDIMDHETDAQCITRRKRDFDAAVARIKQQLRDREDEREKREWELLGDKDEWERHVRKRRRAELLLWCVGEEEEEEEVIEIPPPLPKPAIPENVRHRGQEAVTIQSKGMGGVEHISSDGIAKASAGKKIVFEDQRANKMQGMAGVNGTSKAQTRTTNGVKVNKKRRSKKRTGVPDDDDSSSSESSSSNSESEKKEVVEVLMDKGKGQVNGKKVLTIRATSSEDSDSHSDTSSSSSD